MRVHLNVLNWALLTSFSEFHIFCSGSATCKFYILDILKQKLKCVFSFETDVNLRKNLCTLGLTITITPHKTETSDRTITAIQNRRLNKGFLDFSDRTLFFKLAVVQNGFNPFQF